MVRENAKPPFTEWLNDLNNLLYANGEPTPIEPANADIECDWGIGFSAVEVAERLLNKPITPPRFVVDNWVPTEHYARS